MQCLGDEMPHSKSLQENNSTKAPAASILSAVTAHQTTLVPSFHRGDKEESQQWLLLCRKSKLVGVEVFHVGL